jgi:hypothetical protein
MMPVRTRYGVKFVGYSAYVIARKYGREIDYAQLDFEAGVASIHADGGWVMVPKRTDLGPFLQTLPELANELRDLLCQGTAQVPEESDGRPPASGAAGEMVTMAHGQNTVCVAPGTEVSRFIRQITKRFTEIEQLLEQVEQIGSDIKRRPYSEYIDEIGRTGLARVESHGFGLFVGGRLVFHPNYQVAFTKPRAPNIFEVHLLDSKTEKDSQPN